MLASCSLAAQKNSCGVEIRSSQTTLRWQDITSGRSLKETMMQYMLMIYGNEAGMQNMSKADSDQMHAAYGAYTQALIKAGVMKGGDQLNHSGTATTVRIEDGKTKVLDGPYAETKEQLAGYYIIEVPDADAALSWAAKCPGAGYGAMEVRPIIAMGN
jgi:hypothetical protein